MSFLDAARTLENSSRRTSKPELFSSASSDDCLARMILLLLFGSSSSMGELGCFMMPTLCHASSFESIFLFREKIQRKNDSVMMRIAAILTFC